MKWVALTLLTACLAGLGVPALPRDVASCSVALAAEPQTLEEYIKKRIEDYREGAQRINGVQIKAEVEFKEVERSHPNLRQPVKDTEIRLNWTLDYTGPRQPLTILKPTLSAPVPNQSYVEFLFFTADKKEFPVIISPRVGFTGPWLPPKELFLTVNQGEKATGTLPVLAGEVRGLANQRWPKQFERAEPAAVYVHLRFNPQERGEYLDLDAWTGTLQTELRLVDVKHFSRK